MVPASLQLQPLVPSLVFHSVARLLDTIAINNITRTKSLGSVVVTKLDSKGIRDDGFVANLPQGGYLGVFLTYHDTDILLGGGGYLAQGFPQQGHPQAGYQPQPGYPAQQPGISLRLVDFLLSSQTTLPSLELEMI